jgi:hypothetical protein
MEPEAILSLNSLVVCCSLIARSGSLVMMNDPGVVVQISGVR